MQRDITSQVCDVVEPGADLGFLGVQQCEKNILKHPVVLLVAAMGALRRVRYSTDVIGRRGQLEEAETAGPLSRNSKGLTRTCLEIGNYWGQRRF